MRPTDSLRIADMIRKGLNAAGVQTTFPFLRYLESHGIQGRISHSAQCGFWPALEREMQDPDAALALCPFLPDLSAGVIDYLMLSSANLGEGCHLLIRYQRLLSEGIHVSLSKQEGWARFILTHACPDVAANRHAEICSAYALLRYLQSFAGRDMQPLAVHLRCPAISAQRHYANLFGTTVLFRAAQTHIDFDAAILEIPSRFPSPDIARLHRDLAQKGLRELERYNLVRQVRKALLDHATCVQPTLAEVAVMVGISERRLRFELLQAGTSFRNLGDEVRRDAALKWLSGGDRIDDVALRLGFAENPSFHRAFRRWMGVTPVVFISKLALTNRQERALP